MLRLRKTYAKSYIGQTSSCVGAAAERAASRKVEKYNFLRDTYIFVPLACETTGVWCAEGPDFLNELDRRTSVITGDKHETAYLFQRLSVAIQRGTQLVSIIVFLILITSVNNTPSSAIPSP